MNNEINANLKNLEERINKSNIDDYYKKVLYKMLQTILLSKKCRIYTQNTSNYKEYIALRDQPGDLEQDLSFCVVKRFELLLFACKKECVAELREATVL